MTKKSIEEKLKEAESILEIEEYKLRCFNHGFVYPFESIRDAKLKQVISLRNEVDGLKKELKTISN